MIWYIAIRHEIYRSTSSVPHPQSFRSDPSIQLAFRKKTNIYLNILIFDFQKDLCQFQKHSSDMGSLSKEGA